MNYIRIFILLIFLSILIGGLASIFLQGLEWIGKIRTSYFLFGLPFLGGLFAFLNQKLDFHRTSTSQYLAMIDDPEKKESIWVSIYTILSTWLSHIVGASVGREGTALTMGGSLADTFSSIFKIKKEDKPMIIRAGFAGGFASVFGTPMAGFIFGLEIKKVGSLSFTSLIPCLFTAFFSNFLAIKFFSAKHLIYPAIFLPGINLEFWAKLIILGLFLAIIARIYSALESKISQTLDKLPVNGILKGIFGGTILLIIFSLPEFKESIGLGSNLLLGAFEKISDPLFAFKKLLATAFSLGFGFKGGEATPLFLIGSYSSAGISDLIGLPIGLCAALGFIGLYTGLAKTPLTALSLGIELFGPEGWFAYFIIGLIVTLASGKKGLFQNQEWSNYLYVRKNT